MKTTCILITTFFCIVNLHVFSQCGNMQNNSNHPTSIGIVIYSNDTETVWNALRFANYSKNQGDTVNIFLLGKGVELDNLVKTDTNIKEQTDTFISNGGNIQGCGTCLESRKNNTPQVCKFSSMNDLYILIRKNKIIMTF